MAKKRKTKAAAKKTAKKTTKRRKKIASHGPAFVEGRSTIARDGPAQVDDGGRRRDGG
jgi:hypothetical protein